jgi:hypothetical protein
VKSILDPSFKYTSSTNTDIAKTFARIRRLQRESAGVAAVQMVERPKNVSPFRRPVRTGDRVA